MWAISPQGEEIMLRIIHPIAGVIAIVTIATFWISTVLSEAFGSRAAVIAVKTTIPWGFLLLIPALAATGGSGFVLSKGQRTGRVGAKLKRMPFIAANGLLVLIPSALFLAAKANARAFDAIFYGVQGLELAAGAVNITLLGLSMRDGMRLTVWRRKSFLRPASTYTTSLESREQVAKGTIALRLRKPHGFAFTAGQAVYVTLHNASAPDSKGHARTFSIASAPSDSELVIATRLTDSSFKRALATLPLESTIEIEGPYGDMALHEDAATPAVFLAGGIGITPFRSMILDATARNLPHRLFLFYSTRRPEDAAFLSELRELEQQNTRFRLIETVTAARNELVRSTGERGFITKDMIRKHIGDITAAVYYVAGPPAMVRAMETLLTEAGVSTKNVRAEQFVGYGQPVPGSNSQASPNG